MSASDIVRYLNRHGSVNTLLSAVDVMTKDVITCCEADNLAHVQQLMTAHRIRHVPVVSNGVLHGIVTALDLINDRTRRAEADLVHMRNYLVGAAKKMINMRKSDDAEKDVGKPRRAFFG